MWTADEAWRAPVGDFPPPWASAWGDDPYGLWADLTVNGVTQRMRWIEPSGPEGFLMGSTKEERKAIKEKKFLRWVNRNETEPQKIVIDQGFWLADTPCTQGFWQAVMRNNPSGFKDQPESALRPVEQIYWDDVEKFILRIASTPEWGCEHRLGLPTEAEWEYAARAGSSTAYWWGDAANSDLASWNSEQEGTTSVKRYSANPWGLFDVHGNVWEWCADLWTPRPEAPEAKPDPDVRVVRGGSWFDHPACARSAYRFGANELSLGMGLGFRFALRSSSPGEKPQKGVGPEGPAR